MELTKLKGIHHFQPSAYGDVSSFIEKDEQKLEVIEEAFNE